MTLPSPSDIRTWCSVCGAEDQVEDLLAQTRDVDSLYVEWKRRHKAGMRQLQESYTAEFDNTQRFREYRCDVIPGFVQTHAHAHALPASVARFDRIPDDSPDAATARLARSSIVRPPGTRTFVLLVDEAVLHHRIADDAVMSEQLGYLLAVMAFPAVSLGIVPLRARRDAILPPESGATTFRPSTRAYSVNSDCAAPSAVPKSASTTHGRILLHGLEERTGFELTVRTLSEKRETLQSPSGPPRSPTRRSLTVRQFRCHAGTLPLR
ncbi:Scr1 family TA system antitoxin-like transcriptional regulator [Embleya sp. NPDC050154]|uniref:Scr1 family TA system antitoxin-like transcriptional regulator n=1 Tax=Embleya sp. NPDC050154 TaxID=3363988 RepID=UPI0037ABDB5D